MIAPIGGYVRGRMEKTGVVVYISARKLVKGMYYYKTHASNLIPEIFIWRNESQIHITNL